MDELRIENAHEFAEAIRGVFVLIGHNADHINRVLQDSAHFDPMGKMNRETVNEIVRCADNIVCLSHGITGLFPSRELK